MNNGAGARSASTDSIIIQIIHRQTHTDSLSYDIITHTLDPIQDRIHIQPVRKLSVWRAVLKERYCRTPRNHIRCIWRDQNKQRQPCTTNINDSLDDCYNDAPEDILLSIIQIHTDTTKLLTITLYYTTGTIMLQGRACRKWVNHEFECHKVVVNAVDKLRPCSSNTMNESNCLVPVSVSDGNGGATATITAGTPTTCDNTDNTASVVSYDTVAAVTVAATASYDSDNTAAVSSDVAPSVDTTAAGTTIVSDDSDNTSSFSSDVAPSIDATAAGTTIISDDSDNTASVSSDAAPSAHATVAVSDDSDMKATLERNTRTIKALEDRLSKCSVSPIVNSQSGMQCHTTSGRSLMHRSWMDRPKQAFCRCPKPLRPIKVQHPFSPPPLTRPRTLPPSTRNNQSSCLQTKQRLIALPTAPYLTSE